MEKLCIRCEEEMLSCFFRREGEALSTTFTEETEELLYLLDENEITLPDLLQQAKDKATQTIEEIERMKNQAEQDHCPHI